MLSQERLKHSFLIPELHQWQWDTVKENQAKTLHDKWQQANLSSKFQILWNIL